MPDDHDEHGGQDERGEFADDDADEYDAALTGADGKLTADSIQDPASLPSAPGQ